MINSRQTKTDNLQSTHKRILLISFLEPWSIGPRQGAPSLYETLAGYAREGWQVDYLTFHKRPVLGLAHEKSINVDIPGVREYRFHIPRYRWLSGSAQAKLDRLIFFPLLALPLIVRLLQCRRPTVLYAYEASGILAASLARIFYRRSILIVHRIQGVSILGNSYRKLTFMLRKLESFISLRLRADAYIMTDDGTNGDEVWSYWNKHINLTNLLHIRNGINSQIVAHAIDPEVALQRFGLDRANTHILMLSRLDPIKRVDRGIHALAKISHAFPDVKLIIVGDGEQRVELQNLARDLGVANKIYFLGSLDRGRVAEIFRCSDIFLSLYDFSNCGNPLFEALINGLPIITIDNGTTGKVIDHGVNGLLLPVGDIDALTLALANLLTDMNARNNLRIGASAWAQVNLKSWPDRLSEEIEWLCKKI